MRFEEAVGRGLEIANNVVEVIVLKEKTDESTE